MNLVWFIVFVMVVGMQGIIEAKGIMEQGMVGMQGIGGMVKELLGGELKVHRSEHDEFMKGKTVGRVLAGAENAEMEFRKFRPHFDWRQVEQEVAQKWPGVGDKVEYMKRVFGTVYDYFHHRMEVNSEEKMNLAGVTDCYGYPIPEDLTSSPIAKDMVIQIVPYNEASGWFAAAGACMVDSRNNRPIVGVILLNFYHIQVSQSNEFYVPLVFIHEFMHVMGFSSTFFDMLGMAETIDINGTQKYAITSPKVVEHARKYFGCQQVQGVPLEDNGGSGSKGSHWEKQIFPNEVMNPMVAYPATISDFTVAAFEDMGFYRGVNAAQRYTYLEGSGCDSIIGHKCSGTPDGEYCRSEDMGHDHCYTNKLGKANCGKNSFTGSCGFKSPSHGGLCTLETSNNIKNFNFESYGAHSRCAMLSTASGSYDAGCLRMKCSSTALTIKVGDAEYECPVTGGEVQVYYGSYSGKVVCPKFEEMCQESLEHRCSMDCSGNGYCMGDRTCQCLHGFLGVDCNKGGAKDDDEFVTGYEYRPDSAEEPENEPESPETPESPEDEPERPEDDPESPRDDPETPVDPEVAEIQKQIEKATETLYNMHGDRFKLQIELRKRTLYLESWNNRNWWAKREGRNINRKIRREMNVAIGKAEIEISELNQKIEDKISAEAYEKWETKYFDMRDKQKVDGMMRLASWIDTEEVPQFDEWIAEYQGYVESAAEKNKTEQDQKFKRVLSKVTTEFGRRVTYFLAAKKMLLAAVEDLDAEISTLTGGQRVRSYATAPTNMLKSLKELIAEEDQHNMIQNGLIQMEEKAVTPIEGKRMLSGLW